LTIFINKFLTIAMATDKQNDGKDITDDVKAVERRRLLGEALSVYLKGGEDSEKGGRALFDLLYPKFVRDIQKWGQKLSVAEEIASEVMLKVLRKASSMREPIAFEKWANTVARNTFLTHIRDTKQERDHEVDKDEDEWETLHQIFTDPSQASDPSTMLCLKGQLEKFYHDHPDRANVMEGCVMEGWTTETASEILGRTIAATKEYLSQCRKRLQEYLQPCMD
jgi:RNA polymerase sigma-70 factor, ECF subfamily